MTNIQPTSIVVDGKPIPGPLGLGESLRYWGVDPDSNPDQPNILCVTGRTSRTVAFWFKTDGLNDHQRARLSALPCIPDLEPYMGEDNYSLFCVKRADRQHVAEVLVDVLAATAPIPPDPPFFDIDDAPLSDRWKCFVFLGHDRVNPNRYGSDSHNVMACTGKMVQRGMTNLQIAAILLNPEYGISAHILRQRDPRRAVERAIDKARNLNG